MSTPNNKQPFLFPNSVLLQMKKAADKISSFFNNLNPRIRRALLILLGLSMASICFITTINSYQQPGTDFLKFENFLLPHSGSTPQNKEKVENLFVIGRMHGIIEGKPVSFFIGASYRGQLFTTTSFAAPWRSEAHPNGWTETTVEALSVYEHRFHFKLSPVDSTQQ